MKEEKEEILIGFEERVQNVIFKTKMKMLDIEENRIKNQKISFMDKIIGKEELKYAKLNNLYAKRQLVMMEYNNIDESEHDINNVISDLYAYSYMNLNKQFTDEMLNIYDEICNDYMINELINVNRINELVSKKVNDNINISLDLESNIKGVGKIGKEITKLSGNTDKINRKTKSLEIKKDKKMFKIFEI